MAVLPITGAYKDCLARTSAAAGRELSDSEQEQVFAAAQQRIARNMRNGMTPTDAIKEAATGLAAEHRAASAREQQASLMNLQKRVSRYTKVDTRFKALAGDLAEAFRSLVTSTSRDIQGARDSTEEMQLTRTRQYVTAIVADLDHAGLLKVARDGAIDRDIARELWELSMKDTGEPNNVGVSKNAQALEIASIIRKYQAQMKDRLNSQGAWIGDLSSYIMHQSHDQMQVFKAGMDQWIKDALPKLGPATFDGVEDPQKFMQNVWHALSTGVHLDDGGSISSKDPAFKGPGNVAKKLSQSRVLHFKDAESWMDYRDQYGSHGTLMQTIGGSFERGARQEMLMDRWGTNPRAEYEAMFDGLAQKYRDTNPGAVNKLKEAKRTLDNEFSDIDGTGNRVQNSWLANFSSGLRNIESMSKLGGVVMTHMGALPTKGAELRYHGVDPMSRYGNFFTSFLKGFEGDAQKQVTDLTLASFEGAHVRLMAHGRWLDIGKDALGVLKNVTHLGTHDPNASAMGVMSDLSNKFFSLTGLPTLLSWQKGGTGDGMARHLGSMLDQEHGALPSEVQRTLRLYDISPAEWEGLRNAPDHSQLGGRTFLTPDAALRVDGLDDKAKDMLSLKLGNLYSDIADRAIVTPRARDRQLLLQGTLRGTPVGEAARFFAQFKLWSVAAVRQGGGRELQGGQGMTGAVSGIMQLAVASTLTGYGIETLKALSKGLTPPDPTKLKTWFEAAAQGGGLGILADFLFKGDNRFGQSVAETLAGPVMGSGVSAIMKLFDSVRDGEPAKNIKGEMLKIGTDNTPFINLFYTRSLLNYLFLYSLHETINPGSLARSQQSLQKQTGQQYYRSPAPLPGYFSNPANHLHTFGR